MTVVSNEYLYINLIFDVLIINNILIMLLAIFIIVFS